MFEIEYAFENQNLLMFLTFFAGYFVCFHGYKFFKAILGLIGFFSGGALSYGAIYNLTNLNLLAIPAFIIGGLITAFLLVVFYFFGFFVFGFMFGVVLSAFITMYAGPFGLGISLLIGLVSGILTMKFQKLVIIIYTSFLGAWGITASLAYFTDYYGFFINILWFFIAGTGLILQLNFKKNDNFTHYNRRIHDRGKD
ncbi:MAG: DUF4203 domain-containing protein [Candidatus Muiribacteriota bacterium]